jgi:enoyl-[acyl-carrier-protein] reductase (NADH)
MTDDMFDFEMNELERILKDKEVLITGTANEHSLSFQLAHIVRTYARRTWCCDKDYKMTHEPLGYRIIEGTRVILIKGDLETERDRIYTLISQLGGNISYEINIKGVLK